MKSEVERNRVSERIERAPKSMLIFQRMSLMATFALVPLILDLLARPLTSLVPFLALPLLPVTLFAINQWLRAPYRRN